MLLSGLALIGSGLLVALVAELAARGVLRRNGGAGIRIASVMRTQRTWVVGHRAARWWLHGAACSICASGLLSVVAARRIADMGLLAGMAVGVSLVGVAAMIAHRAALEVED